MRNIGLITAAIGAACGILATAINYYEGRDEYKAWGIATMWAINCLVLEYKLLQK